jgi:hypothetical protein
MGIGNYLKPQVSGDQLFQVFATVTALIGLVNTANFAVFSKLTDIQKNSTLGYWAHLRLMVKTGNRRDVIRVRSLTAFILVVIAGVISAYMKSKGQNAVEGWLVGATAYCLVLSGFMGFLTVNEVYLLSKFEADMNELNKEAKAKHEARKSISSESE